MREPLIERQIASLPAASTNGFSRPGRGRDGASGRMTRRLKILNVLVLLMSFTASRFSAEELKLNESATLSADQIFLRLEKENRIRAARLQNYSSVRRYSVFEKNEAADAEVKISMQYVSPSTKTFRVISQNGAGWITKQVFYALIRAEQEAATGKNKTTSAIISANYDTRLLGEAQYQNRDCYLLELHPRRRDKVLIEGKIWVDKQDFAIVKLEGEPSKSLSFWVTRTHLVREYQKIGEFWLQLRDQTHAQVRFVGEYILQIDYGNYIINSEQSLITPNDFGTHGGESYENSLTCSMIRNDFFLGHTAAKREIDPPKGLWNGCSRYTTGPMKSSQRIGYFFQAIEFGS
jgi:hypothetical protein